jgi:titin
MKLMALTQALGRWGALLAALQANQCDWAATYTVTTTADSGPGSLRQALLDANGKAGPDTIEFRLSGSPPFSIAPLSGLPGVYDPVAIDGTTQAGYAGRPIIELRGSSAGSAAFGLRILTSNCVVRALVINRFARDGIRLEDYGGNTVQGNYLGTDVAGTRAYGNGWGGITVMSASNLIGGVSAGQGNLISGGQQSGVYLQDAAAASNTVCGNLIGTDYTGAVRLPNQYNGVVISGAAGNVVGGTAPGSGNVISGNAQSGVYILNRATNNFIQGNLIGLGLGGATLASNAADGITINGSSQNVIGGTDPLAGNVVSGNGARGILISGTTSTANLVQGNLIGTDAAGGRGLGNTYAGIEIQAGTGNQIGGSRAGAGNIIGANRQSGVALTGTNAFANTIQGNLIGTDRTGTNALGNLYNGVYLAGPDNLVGGMGEPLRNLISGNTLNGIYLATTGARSNRIVGNFIGTDLTGTRALGNGNAGIWLEGAPDAIIGGASAGEGNLVSGNTNSGIVLNLAATTRVMIQGNRVGTDAAGSRAVANLYGGIYLYNAPSNQIGGTSPGAGNVVSGNLKVGIGIGDAASIGNVVAGNSVGLAADGTTALGNEWHGVELLSSASSNTVGGLTASARNRIANARTVGYDGIRVRNGCTNNTLLGNELFANGAGATNGLGIDLGADGVTANDHCDADTGANNLQNFPVLQAFAQPGGVLVAGSLDSVAGRTYRVELFANASLPASGCGQGERFLGAAPVSTAATCQGNFSLLLAQALPPGYYLSATATDSAGNTSEFAASVPVQEAPSLLGSTDIAGQTFRLSWRQSGATYRLDTTTNLSPPIQWAPVSVVPDLIGGTNVVSLPLTDGTHFYRLILAL